MKEAIHTADIVIAGAGLAGLTLALECVHRPFFRDKRIVLLDRDNKNSNDRTWCFWATEAEKLPPVLYKTWEKCLFYNHHFSKSLDIAPYRYCMIRGLDFYRYAQQTLAQYSNVEWVQAEIQHIDAENGVVETDKGHFQGEWIFNAVAPLPKASAEYTLLLQHFKGWIIETPSPTFDPEAMTFMDYRIPQEGETRFVYVLPLSSTRALVEFTVFSPALLPQEAYDEALKTYIESVLAIQTYQVEETEFGVIPMTDLPLSPRGKGREIRIGTAGGFVKASSGYAFLRTQRKIRAFVEDWERHGQPRPEWMQSGRLFRSLDAIMLRVLRDGSVPGHRFFTLLFQKLPAPLVFRFLDEDSGLRGIFRLLMAPPFVPFLKTAIRLLPRLLRDR